MTKLNTYIAGPMRGHNNLNREAFYMAENYLNATNIHDTHNPAKWDEDLGLTTEDLEKPDEVSKALQRDLNAIFDCDCIYMLRGWEKSAGAKLEHELAVVLGMTILYQ